MAFWKLRQWLISFLNKKTISSLNDFTKMSLENRSTKIINISNTDFDWLTEEERLEQIEICQKICELSIKYPLPSIDED